MEYENKAEAKGREKKHKRNSVVVSGAIYISSDEEEEDGRRPEIQIHENNNNSVDSGDRPEGKASRTIYSKGKNLNKEAKSSSVETNSSEYEKYDWETSSQKNPNINESEDPSPSPTLAETLNKDLVVASRKRSMTRLTPSTASVNFVHYKLLTPDLIWMKFIDFARMTVQTTGDKRRMNGMRIAGGKFQIIFEKIKFNQYEATAQNIADFLFYMERTENVDLESDEVRILLAGLARYLPNLKLVQSSASGDSTQFDISSFSPSFMVRECFDSFLSALNHPKIEVRGNRGKSNKFVPSIYQLFRQHCECYFKTDPILASPKIVVDFLLHLFRDKVRNNTSDHMVPFNNFYMENVKTICKEVDTFLKCSFTSSVLESPEVIDLLTVAEAADENTISNDDAMKLYPDHHYAKKRLKLRHEESFWNGSLLKKVVFDIRFNKSLDVYTAAKELGVTSEMLYHRIMSESTEENEDADDFAYIIPSLCEFLKKTNSSPKLFWKEESVKDLLDDVRNREKTVADAAALFGVGRKEIMKRCGNIKTKDEIQESIKEEKIKKILEKEEQDKMKKKVTMLDKQIMFAEENEEMLCDYELARLANMRERKELMAKLNFEEDKNELRKITKVAKVEKIANSPDAEQLQKRGKSVRVQRKMEADRLKHGDRVSVQPGRGGRCEKRITPKWFGETVPDTSKLQLEKLVKATPVPKFDLIAPQLLEMTSDYRRSAIFLDSVSCEAKDLAHKKEAKFKMNEEDWIQFEAEEETIVSTSRVTSLDSFNDFFCYGTEAGGVGVVLAGESRNTESVILSPSLPRPQRDHQTSQRRGDRSGDGGAEDHVHQHGRHGQVGAGTVIFVTSHLNGKLSGARTWRPRPCCWSTAGTLRTATRPGPSRARWAWRGGGRAGCWTRAGAWWRWTPGPGPPAPWWAASSPRRGGSRTRWRWSRAAGTRSAWCGTPWSPPGTCGSPAASSPPAASRTRWPRPGGAAAGDTTPPPPAATTAGTRSTSAPGGRGRGWRGCRARGPSPGSARVFTAAPGAPGTRISSSPTLSRVALWWPMWPGKARTLL